MNYKQIYYSILNSTGVQNRILEKKKIQFQFFKNVNTTIQKLLLFKKSKLQLSSTKTRKNVQGGGKKPWKQKGTGKARAGSIRSPLFVGGGIIFGPKYRIKLKKINKKERHLFFTTLFYLTRFKFLVVQTLALGLKKFLLQKGNLQFLIILDKTTSNLKYLIRNFKNCEYAFYSQLTVKHFITKKRIIITHNILQKLINTF